jgi:cardiolipin synthase A/B
MWVFLLSALSYLLGIALIIFVIMQRKEPTSTAAWILVIITLPIIGVLLYIWFGYGRIFLRVQLREQSNKAIADDLDQIEQTLIDYKIVPGEAPNIPVQSELVQVTEKSNSFSVTHGNSFHLLTEPEDVFTQLEDAIKSAEDSIHMEYYIFRRDKTGKRIRDLLAEAAARGVEVRLLVDGVGSWTIGNVFMKPLKDAGAKFAKYLPVTFLGRPWHWNLRNHRKITVIDGSVGYIGSANIGDEYRMRSGNVTDFYDEQIKCEGPVVQQLQEVFAGDWFFATGENLLHDRYFPLPVRHGTTAGQIITSGPDDPRHTFHEMLCAALHAATKSVRIVTPYFIPDQALIVALRTAAMRGVHVEIMLARNAPSFHERLIGFAGRSYYEDLLSYEIDIYEYLPGFLHAKSVIIDSAWASVGTANMDIRSFRLNFEVNINFYSQKTCSLLTKDFEENLKRCERITLETFKKRSYALQCAENSLRVFSPIL